MRMISNPEVPTSDQAFVGRPRTELAENNMGSDVADEVEVAKYTPEIPAEAIIQELADKTGFSDTTIKAAFELFKSKESVLDIESDQQISSTLLDLAQKKDGEQKLLDLIDISNRYAKALLIRLDVDLELKDYDLMSAKIDENGEKTIFSVKTQNGIMHLPPRVYQLLANVNREGVNTQATSSLDNQLGSFLSSIEGKSYYKIQDIKDELQSASDYEQYFNSGNDRGRTTDLGLMYANLIKTSFEILL